ncbi:hypothetical protein LTS08_006487 [Lithohypha guttulata]|nr:hypothetical protein LTS08_006487 [Lithohypha guttulata]
MSREPLLIDLCSICHANAVKYTCPRCGTHTCSLPCVKKHKTWAQCSGVRNPAEYRKRADLATPSSIDKDFNFIAGVERSITRADDNALDRGINLAPARQLKPYDARPKVEMEIEERNVKVVRAPKGLSRSKQNKTHWVGQQKSVMWTIEWLCQDGERVVGSCPEKRLVGESYIGIVGKKKVQRKRKFSMNEPAVTAYSGAKALKQEPPTSHVLKQEGAVQDASQQEEGANEMPAEQEENRQGPHKDTLSGIHFYLHNPTTSSKVKCLIPIPQDQTIRAVLEGRTVMEFPTFYAIREDPTRLKPPLISQEEYDKHHGNSTQVDVSVSLEDGEVDDSTALLPPTVLDSHKVMEVLARDLGG